MELKGQEDDLADLAHWTTGNPVKVTGVNGHYELLMPFAVVGFDYKTVKVHAEQYVAALNGLGAVFERAFRKVELIPGMYSVDEHGARHDVVVSLVGVESARVRVGRINALVDGKTGPDPTLGMAEPYLKVAVASSDIDAALRLLGRGDPTWSELYVVFELAKAASGDELVAKGWASENELTRFGHTANNYTALGLQARHGPSRHLPPRNPMTYDEALELMRATVAAWLRDEVNKPLRAGIST